MPEIDLFNFFRWALFIFVSIYCTLITAQSLWSWYVWLASDDRYMTILRRYVILHGLRLRFGTFWGDVLICVLLSIVFLLMMWAHAIIRSMNDVLLS